jgi:hypothetical protein
MFIGLIMFAACLAVLAVIGAAVTTLPSRLVSNWSRRSSARNGQVPVTGSPWPATLFPPEVPKPAKRRIETYFDKGEWKNKVEGSSRAANRHATKAAAVKAGREMARKRKVDHVVMKKDGSIGETFTHGDPQMATK